MPHLLRFGSLALAVGLTSVVAGCTPQTVVNNQGASVNSPPRGVMVSGQGKASGKPDIARATIGFESRAATAEAAVGEVNSRMAQVIGALKESGVADKDLRTATLSLNFERTYDPPRPVEAAPAVVPQPAAPVAPGKARPGVKAEAPAKPEVAPVKPETPAAKLPQGFYTAQNTVEVTIRNLDRAGALISAATSAGANQIYGLRFEIEDPSALQVEARQKAVADARARAEKLAQLTGVTLGPAVSVSELDAGSPGPVPMYSAAMRSDASAPVERGELTVTSVVQIVYSLPE